MPATIDDVITYRPEVGKRSDRGIIFASTLFDYTSLEPAFSRAFRSFGVTLPFFEAVERVKGTTYYEDPIAFLRLLLGGAKTDGELAEALEYGIFFEDHALRFADGLDYRAFTELSSRYTLGLVSEMEKESLQRLFDYTTYGDTLSMFRSVVTRSDYTTQVPNSIKMNAAITRLRLESEATIYIVADSEAQAQAAVAAQKRNEHYHVVVLGLLHCAEDPVNLEGAFRKLAVQSFHSGYELMAYLSESDYSGSDENGF